MDKKKYLYISFLDLTAESGGGHIETFSEIKEFNKLFGEVDIICIGENKRAKNLKLKNKITFVRPFCKFLPIFGKRPLVSLKLLRNYDGIIIADSRCFIPFLISLFSTKNIYFKSHGSLAIYFYSYFISNFSLFRWQPLISIFKTFYYIILIIFFTFVELFIYIFSVKIFMMRSKISFESSLFGKLYSFLFSNKTKFSYCPSLINFNINRNLKLSTKIKKEDKLISILIFGNWNLPHNFVSLIDFLIRLSSNKECKVNIVGKINDSNYKILKKLKLKRFVSLNIIGYVHNLDELKRSSSHVVSCAKYGSGIPIKCLEIISEADIYKYLPISSTYCQKALDGLSDINIITYPSKGSIYID
tara:strand:+ start:107 stop:1183 length:1077 start_codon:yes stop_codon:yes gene_type:complete